MRDKIFIIGLDGATYVFLSMQGLEPMTARWTPITLVLVKVDLSLCIVFLTTNEYSLNYLRFLV